jgi:hypothetical protein
MSLAHTLASAVQSARRLALVCLFVASAVLLGARSAHADASPHRLHVSAGLGFAFPTDDDLADTDAEGTGGFGEVEYVYAPVEWATPRAYAGLLLTGANGDCPLTPCDVSAKIGFLGVKGRLLAPIPYVAPFFELGFGASVGSMSTRAGGIVDIERSGVMYHVPFALGLALGEHHEFELSLQYLLHPEQRQFGGALAIGFGFPLD